MAQSIAPVVLKTVQRFYKGFLWKPKGHTHVAEGEDKDATPKTMNISLTMEHDSDGNDDDGYEDDDVNDEDNDGNEDDDDENDEDDDGKGGPNPRGRGSQCLARPLVSPPGGPSELAAPPDPPAEHTAALGSVMARPLGGPGWGRPVSSGPGLAGVSRWRCLPSQEDWTSSGQRSPVETVKRPHWWTAPDEVRNKPGGVREGSVGVNARPREARVL
ncbi:hypothetical protein EGW08_016562 [Elysia chlorotica]|uniref:Uncharacterized protein n=1 Tax=Elysia chlorotica TaxID=188477 RepID=A0A3S1B5U8_ELYCH|nr:hypothetical protein EGW08_016562 [Elysia chlorotica]